jgi:hypothetical protein
MAMTCLLGRDDKEAYAHWQGGWATVEYLIVHFPRSRRVKVDDEFNGRTGELIELEAGSHVVTLGPPDNFAPEERRIVLRDTAELEPREIGFDLDE